MKNKFVYLVTIVLAVLYLAAGHYFAVQGLSFFKEKSPTDVVEARVVKLLPAAAGAKFEQIRFEAELLSGRQEGVKVTAAQNKAGSFAVGRDVAVGDKVLLLPGQSSQGEWSYAEHLRSNVLMWLFAVFALSIIAFGRMQGVNTLISLLFCCLSIFAVFVPAILSGKNVYCWTILTCAFIVVTNLLLVNGISRKTVATILGCIGGLVIAALISASADSFLQLTGLVDEDSMYLLFLNPADPVDLKAIIFSAIIIGALGAIMDVAMDIASALNELAATTAEPTRKMLLQAGNNIGRDILGMMSNTLILAYIVSEPPIYARISVLDILGMMSNTLILAYIGGSLTIVLLFFAYNHSLLYLLNKEMVVVEILQAVIGSFGILFTIPFTSFICSRLYVKKAGRRHKSGLENKI